MARTFEVDAVIDLIAEACQSRGAETWAASNDQPEVYYPQGVRPWVDIKPEIEQVLGVYIAETITPPPA